MPNNKRKRLPKKKTFEECIDIIDAELIILKNTTTYDLSIYTNVFLNGRLIGLHKSPKLLLKYMKLLKLNSFINIIKTSNDVNYLYVDSNLLDFACSLTRKLYIVLIANFNLISLF